MIPQQAAFPRARDTRPSRRRLLRALPAALAGTATGAPAPRPNILWLIGEDLCPDLGCYGVRAVHTPNLDRLAAEGVRFDNAFSTGPICSPSRSAIATGVYQTRIDAGHQRSHRTDGYRPPPPIRLFTHLLRDAGYHTSIVRTPAPGLRGSRKTDFNFQAESVFEGDDWNQRAPGQPFYAQVGFAEAHRPFHRSEPAVDPAKVKLPAYLPDHPAVREDWAMYLESIQALDQKVGRVLERIDREGLRDSTVVVFFGDNGREMPRDKTFVYEGGLHVPLIARFPKQFAPAGVKPGSVRGDLASLIDVTSTTLELAGIPTPAWMDGRPLFGPRHRPRPYIFGAEDRCDLAVDCVRSVRTRRYKYLRNFYPARPYLQHDPYMDVANIPLIVARQLAERGGLNAAQQVLVARSRPEEELYDLASDPEELRNLARDPARQPELKRLRQVLADWIRDTGDRTTAPAELPAEYATWATVDGWANVSPCRLAKVGGRLRMECPGQPSRIRSGLVARGGPFRLAFRIRSTGIAKGKAIWGSIAEAANPAFARDFDLAAGGGWQEIQADFAVTGHLAWVGFDFGAAAGAVEFEWIRLSDARAPVREWRFG